MPQSPSPGPSRLTRLRPHRRAAIAVTTAAATVLLGGSAAAIVAGAALTTTAAQATTAAPAAPAANRAAAPTAALSASWYGSAPYYSTLDANAPNLSQVMSATGQKAFDLAFILAGGGACSPSWDGSDPVSADTQVAGVISQVRAAGGDVIVSAGGANGTKLGSVCSSAAATAAAYQQVITTYGLHAFDLDLEEPEIENATAIANELGAAQILQREDPGLFVAITLPTTPTGANFFGQALLNEARSLGFTPDDYTIMPFDNGFSGGASQVTALQDFNGQLAATFGWTSAQAYAHEGFSGMNGRSDTGEMFTQADFQTVLTFAENNHLGRFSFWSVNRDRQCTPASNNGTTSSDCSSVSQNSWDFTAVTVAFAQDAPPTAPTPPTSPTPTPTPTPPTPTPTAPPSGGSGNCAAAWVSNQAYVAGNVASSNGHNWTANQWNYDEVPGGAAGAWNDDGAC